MPSGKIAIGHRDHILGRKFFKELKLAHPELELTWSEVVDIIRETNKEIANIITNDQAGFKLPENHGYIVVTSFKSNHKTVDLENTKKFRRAIYHLNLHSFGHRLAIKWINNNRLNYFPKIYKFKACRTLCRQVAKSGKSGFNYLNWSKKDFIKFDKIYKSQENRNKGKWE